MIIQYDNLKFRQFVGSKAETSTVQVEQVKEVLLFTPIALI